MEGKDHRVLLHFIFAFNKKFNPTSLPATLTLRRWFNQRAVLRDLYEGGEWTVHRVLWKCLRVLVSSGPRTLLQFSSVQFSRSIVSDSVTP